MSGGEAPGKIWRFLGLLDWSSRTSPAEIWSGQRIVGVYNALHLSFHQLALHHLLFLSAKLEISSTNLTFFKIDSSRRPC